jgi:two-component system NarL family response regulator
LLTTEFFREGLAQLLSSQEDMQVVGEADDGLEAVEKAKELRPDLVIMDIRMPNMNGLEACRLIKAALPDTRVVMLTVSDSDEDLFQAIKFGAIGYLLKNLKARRLFDQLRSAYRGEAALSPFLAMRVLEEFARERQREELRLRAAHGAGKGVLQWWLAASPTRRRAGGDCRKHSEAAHTQHPREAR